MKISQLKIAFSIVLLTLLLSACSKAESWNGTYQYFAEYGESASDTPMSVSYKLVISDNQCSIEIDGYQTYRMIFCFVQENKNSAIITFKEYSEDSIIYPKNNLTENALLFRLTKKDNVITTEWNLLNPDVTDNKSSVYFKKLSQ